MKNDLTKEKYEEGWEFIVPRYLINPLNWLLVILIVIAIILTFILVTKTANQQHKAQATVTNSQ